MAFEPIYEVIKSDYKKRLTATQVVAECKLIPDSGIMIAKVLAITADAYIDSFEALNGEARYNGHVNFKVMFTDDNGGNHSLDYNANFSDKISDRSISPSLKLGLNAAVLDTDTVSVSPSEIKLATVVEITAEGLISDNINFLSNGGADIFTQEEEISYAAALAYTSLSFNLSEEIDPKLNIQKILSCDSAAICKKAKGGLDCIIIEGCVVSNICCETEGGLIKSIVNVAEFSEEISARGASADQLADASVKLLSCAVSLQKDVSGEKNLVKLEYKLDAQAASYSENKVKAVVDAFCIRNEIKITGESFPLTRFVETKSFFDKIEGTASLDVDMPEVDNILSVCASRLNITGSYAIENKIVVEGVVNTSVIYYNAASDTKNSIAVELPYSLTINYDGAKENYSLLTRGIIMGANAKIKRGNEIEIFAEVLYSVSFYDTANAYVIKEITLGEEKTPSKSAIAIYVTKGGETLWDIAKSLMSTPEIILAQNPSLKVPAEANERILVYKQLEAEIK